MIPTTNLASSSIADMGTACGPTARPADPKSVDLFQCAMQDNNSLNIRSVVESTQTSFTEQTSALNAKFKSMRGNLDAGAMVSMMWESSTTSVGLQLASKAFSKSTESFEKLLFQQ